MLNLDQRPPITVSTLDAERLERLLDGMTDAEFPGRAALLEELARADFVSPEQVPPTVVTMNSTVRFQVEPAPAAFELTLVYPKDVDGSGTRISVFAPVGSALLGLSQGDEISWPGPGGEALRVRIIEVVYQPERAGVFHH